jgi:hypothetical protein
MLLIYVGFFKRGFLHGFCKVIEMSQLQLLTSELIMKHKEKAHIELKPKHHVIQRFIAQNQAVIFT